MKPAKPKRRSLSPTTSRRPVDQLQRMGSDDEADDSALDGEEDDAHVVSVDDISDDETSDASLSSPNLPPSSSERRTAMRTETEGPALSPSASPESSARDGTSYRGREDVGGFATPPSSRTPTKTFATAKRSAMGGKNPLRHGLGMQRSKAIKGYADGMSHLEGKRDYAAADVSATPRNSECEATSTEMSDDDASEHDEFTISENTDDVTEEFDTETVAEELSDDDRELQYSFSDGSMISDDPSPRRNRRAVILDKTSQEEGASSDEKEDGNFASPHSRTNTGPNGSGVVVHTNKALKLLGLQERGDASDLFNSAAMSPLDLEGSPKKKGTIRAYKGKVTRTGEKIKMRTTRAKDSAKLSGRSQSDSRLDVIERGDGSPGQAKMNRGTKQRTSIKNMRASLKSQFSVDGRRINDMTASGTQFTSKIFTKKGESCDDDELLSVKRITGTIDQLILLLFDTVHIESDKDYESDFLLLYRFFIKPKTLLKKFIEMYRKTLSHPPGTSAEKIAEAENEQYRIKKRIIELIRNWTKIGFDDLNEDANFMQKLTFFINNVLSPQERTESKINVELTQLIERRNAVYKKQKEEEELAKARFIPLKPDQCHRVKKLARRLNFLDTRTKEVVEELTFIERSLFVAIKPWEFLAVLWNSIPPTPEELKRQPNYNKWEEHKKKLENWVISEIITRPDLTERTLTLKKFIDITRFAHKNGNLNCVHTIITALLSPSIKRLTKTWSSLPGKTVASFEKLCARVNEGEQTDYQAYTNLLKEGRTLPFILPSLSVFAREISSLKKAKHEDESGDKDKASIDFTLLRRAAAIMQEVQGYQQRGSPALTSRPILNKFLRQHHRSLPDNVIYYFSRHCESEEDGTSKEIQIDSLDPGLVYAISAGRFYVKSGNPKALSSKVMDKWLSSLDPDFRDAVILNRAYWLSAVDLFNKLTECYPKQPQVDSFGMFREGEVQLADVQERLRTVDAIRFWMEVEMNELRSDAAFVQRLQEFVNSTYFINNNEASFFLQLRETFKPVRPPPSASVLPVISQEIPGLSERPSTIEYPLEEKLISKTFPRELAECITIIDQNMLKAIPPKELVRKAYTKPEKSPFMAAMVNHFNSVSSWVATVIVMEHNLQKRAQIVTQFILAAWECRLIQNFNGSYAIVAALNNAAISRLKQTWALVPSRVLSRWRELEFLFDYPGAFRNYREAIAKTKPPVIPFLANYSKNLFGIEENNLVYIEEGVVNFERFVMLVSQIRDLQTYQQYTYPFTVDQHLYDYLIDSKNKMVLSEDEFYEMSQEREGKATCNPDDPSSASGVSVSQTLSTSGSTPSTARSSHPISAPPSNAGQPSSPRSPIISALSSSSETPTSSPVSARMSSPCTSRPATPASPISRISSGPSTPQASPLFSRKIGKSAEEPDPTLRQLRNPIFGARLPPGGGVPSPVSAKRSTQNENPPS